MKTICRIAPLLLSVMLIGCAPNPAQHNPAQNDPASSGVALAPAGAGFTVNMPGTVKQKISPTGTHFFTTLTDGVVYIVSYADVKNEQLTQTQLDGALDSLARSEARNDGKLLSMKRISMDGHDGRELTIMSPDGMFVHLRLTLVHGRRFRAGVATKVHHTDTPEIIRFLDSFHITRH